MSKEHRRLRAGDTILCRDDEDLRQTLRDLGEAGIRAVTWDVERHIIAITKDEEVRSGYER